MREILFHRISALVLLLPLFGCAQSIDLSADPSTQISVTSSNRVSLGQDQTVASPTGAARLLSAGELGSLSNSEAGSLVVSGNAGFVSDSLPFVRSRPKVVPPFPLVL